MMVELKTIEAQQLERIYKKKIEDLNFCIRKAVEQNDKQKIENLMFERHCYIKKMQNARNGISFE